MANITYKVLVVEDDKDTASMIMMTLKRLGFFVEAVHDGNEALPKIKIWKPDVVILDLELPGKTGFQIMQEMFLDVEMRNTIIIANTIHMDAKDDLGFAFFAHYQRVKNQEPIMINKLQQEGDDNMDLPLAIAGMLGEKFGAIPVTLAEHLKKNGKWRPNWSMA